MKLIDLLNKIANGEQPNKIKYQGIVYFKSGMNYVNIDEFIPRIFMQHIFENSLNDEVEIVEEKEDTPKVQVEMTQEDFQEYLKSNPPKKWEIKDGRFVVDKILEDGSVIIAEEDEKIEPINVNLDYLDFDILFQIINIDTINSPIFFIDEHIFILTWNDIFMTI